MPLCVPRSYLCFESSKSGSSKRNKVIKLVDITDIQKVSVACGVRLGARHVCGERGACADARRWRPLPGQPPTAPWAGARARSDHSTAGPSSVRPHASGQVRHSFVCGRGRAPAPPSLALSPSWLLAAAGRLGPCGSRGPWARRSRRPWVQAGGSALPAGRGDRVLPSSSTRSFPCCRARAWGSPCQRHRPRK